MNCDEKISGKRDMHLDIFGNIAAMERFVIGTLAILLSFFMEKSVLKKYPDYSKGKLKRNAWLVRILGVILLIIGLASIDNDSGKRECERLMNENLRTAREMLTQHKEFYPYGASIPVNGKERLVSVWNGEERPESKPIIEGLKRQFTEEAERDEIKAIAIFYDVKIDSDKSGKTMDAIAVDLEHLQGYSATVLIPYSFNENNELNYLDMRTNSRKNVIFT